MACWSDCQTWDAIEISSCFGYWSGSPFFHAKLVVIFFFFNGPQQWQLDLFVSCCHLKPWLGISISIIMPPLHEFSRTTLTLLPWTRRTAEIMATEKPRHRWCDQRPSTAVSALSFCYWLVFIWSHVLSPPSWASWITLILWPWSKPTRKNSNNRETQAFSDVT